MWRDMGLSDFSIVSSGGREIPCHKVVLCAASPVLKGLISADMEEGRQGFYNIDETEDCLRALLQFMYIGSLPVEVDHNLLLSLTRLSDYLQVSILWDECASMLLPLVCEDNIIAVLHVLAPLRQFNRNCENLFTDVMKIVKHNQDMLLLVCSSVAPTTFHEANAADQFTPQWDAALHIHQSAPSHGLPEYERGTSSTLQSAVIWDGSKQHGSQGGMDSSNEGPSHVQSGSSKKSERPNRESKDPATRQKLSTNLQKDVVGASMPSNLKLAVSPKSQNIEALGLECSKMFSDTSADQSDGAAGAAAQPAGPYPIAQHRSSGPRRKTRRGKTPQRRQCPDQTSVPDARNPWNSKSTDASPKQCPDQTSITDTYNPWDSESIDA